MYANVHSDRPSNPGMRMISVRSSFVKILKGYLEKMCVYVYNPPSFSPRFSITMSTFKRFYASIITVVYNL